MGKGDERSQCERTGGGRNSRTTSKVPSLRVCIRKGGKESLRRTRPPCWGGGGGDVDQREREKGEMS